MNQFVSGLFRRGAVMGMVALLPLLAGPARAAAPPLHQWGDWPDWGDQGDGTYHNPVLPADFSDLDCIRVGPDYYAMSSTFQFSPGVVILHSKDLVNWEILGHVVTDLNQIGPELDWTRMNRYGKGVWAGAIRFHDQKFWVYFGTPDEGYFMSTAANPTGPWAPLHPVLKEAGWDDCCPFWDDDGQGWLVGTHTRDNYKTYLFKLTADGREILKETGLLLTEGSGREANKLYKINGWYYHLFSEHQGATGRYVMMQRAKSINGPWTEVKQLNHADRPAKEPNQGGLVQTEQGDWYWFTHHGTGDWEGRCASLLPVTWIDGWPIIGQVAADGIGGMVWSGKKPVAGVPIVAWQTDDEFDQSSLPPQWEWNYQPRADKWSLTERPGWLRLRAFPPLAPDNLLKAGNTLTQRSLRASTNEVVIKLDLAGMADGQKAGLCHFASPHYSALGVSQTAGTRALEFSTSGRITAGPALTGANLWLKSTWGLDGGSHYAYSLDGKAYIAFGDAYQLQWGSYRGDRIGIYSYNNQADAGFIDVDWFHYTCDGPWNRKK
ncbi:MAG: glycoside hydrolase 43 family protein [Verrucomicrobiota bacterium]|jgi:beta-xylosidase